MILGGVVLCGGRSSRMGRPKAWLRFGSERMLQRVVRIVSEAAAPVCVVAAPGQDLPELPAAVLVARDRDEGRGPLLGMAAGLRRLSQAGAVDAAYVSSCDVPFLSAGFIRQMAERLGPADIAVPRTHDYFHPLAGVYRIGVLAIIERMIAETTDPKQLRPARLFELASTQVIEEAELRALDPGLASLRNLNNPDDYAAALRSAGLADPESTPEPG